MYLLQNLSYSLLLIHFKKINIFFYIRITLFSFSLSYHTTVTIFSWYSHFLSLSLSLSYGVAHWLCSFSWTSSLRHWVRWFTLSASFSSLFLEKNHHLFRSIPTAKEIISCQKQNPKHFLWVFTRTIVFKSWECRRHNCHVGRSQVSVFYWSLFILLLFVSIASIEPSNGLIHVLCLRLVLFFA